MRPVFEVTDAEMSFCKGDNAPPEEEVPKEFFKTNNKWNQLVSEWFFLGVSDLPTEAKDGVDQVKALRAVTSIIGSWSYEHNYKIAACAFLMSEWFKDWDTHKEAPCKKNL